MTLYTANPSNPASCDAFRRALGFRTREELAEAYQRDLERYADMIERGQEWGVPPPALRDARKLLAEREALTAKVETELRDTMQMMRKRA